RLEVLYRLDQEAPIRTSQDNPSVREIYSNWLGEPDSETSHRVLHTSYRRRSMRREAAGELIVAEPVAIEIGVCIGTNCFIKGSWKLLEGLSAELRRRGLSDHFRVKARFCTGQCQGGPNVTVGKDIISVSDPSQAAVFVDERLMPLLKHTGESEGN
ncbi:MAG: iron hydrogenase small subunit, partial [Syntrophales bacterium]|nr:iron hydrogenase small subunit [Syntrophales bacterium]